MTYFDKMVLPSLDRSQGSLSNPASIALNQRTPCSSITHNNLTVNASGQLVLDANHTFILSGSPYQEGTSGVTAVVDFVWYDVTNSVELGRAVEITTNNGANTFGMRGCLARCVIETTAQTTVEFRIKSLSGNPAYINQNISYDYVGNGWFSVLSF
tara:strand:+ start:705 stop:1172 length:468 start_codon:yes stop_codon:yes gene_type:complete